MSASTRCSLVAAVHLFLFRNQTAPAGNKEILLLRRFRTGFQDGNYSVPAGHLDGGEEIKHACAREAREECGIEIDPQNLSVIGVMHRLSDNERVDFFLTTAHWRGEIVNREPDKCDDLSWHHLAELPPNVIPYVRQALQRYQSSEWFSEFGFSDQTAVYG